MSNCIIITDTPIEFEIDIAKLNGVLKKNFDEIELITLSESVTDTLTFGGFEDRFILCILSELSDLTFEFVKLLDMVRKDSYKVLTGSLKIDSDLSRLKIVSMQYDIERLDKDYESAKEITIEVPVVKVAKESILKRIFGKKIDVDDTLDDSLSDRVSMLADVREQKDIVNLILSYIDELGIDNRRSIEDYLIKAKSNGIVSVSKMLNRFYLDSVVSSNDVISILKLHCNKSVFSMVETAEELYDDNKDFDFYTMQRDKLFILSKDSVFKKAKVVCELDSLKSASDWCGKNLSDYSVYYEVTLQAIVSEYISRFNQMLEEGKKKIS